VRLGGRTGTRRRRAARNARSLAGRRSPALRDAGAPRFEADAAARGAAGTRAQRVVRRILAQPRAARPTRLADVESRLLVGVEFRLLRREARSEAAALQRHPGVLAGGRRAPRAWLGKLGGQALQCSLPPTGCGTFADQRRGRFRLTLRVRPAAEGHGIQTKRDVTDNWWGRVPRGGLRETIVID